MAFSGSSRSGQATEHRPFSSPYIKTPASPIFLLMALETSSFMFVPVSFLTVVPKCLRRSSLGKVGLFWLRFLQRCGPSWQEGRSVNELVPLCHQSRSRGRIALVLRSLPPFKSGPTPALRMILLTFRVGLNTKLNKPKQPRTGFPRGS